MDKWGIVEENEEKMNFGLNFFVFIFSIIFPSLGGTKQSDHYCVVKKDRRRLKVVKKVASCLAKTRRPKRMGEERGEVMDKATLIYNIIISLSSSTSVL